MKFQRDYKKNFMKSLIFENYIKMNFCIFSKFKNLLGESNKGIHKYKLLDTSIIDYLLTLVLAFLVSYFTKLPLVLSTIFSFIIGIFLHILFGVETNVVKYLNIKCIDNN